MGPPGTGKTIGGMAIITALVACRPKLIVVVTANAAVE